jgi:hypothetical protein
LAVAKKILRLAALFQDFGSRFRRRQSASSSPFTRFRQSLICFSPVLRCRFSKGPCLTGHVLP